MTSSKTFQFYIAGVQFHEAKNHLKELEEAIGADLQMVPEPTNKFDPNAIRLHFESPSTEREVMLGFVPKKIAPAVGAFLLTAEEPTCELSNMIPSAKPWEQLQVRIYDAAHVDEPDEEVA